MEDDSLETVPLTEVRERVLTPLQDALACLMVHFGKTFMFSNYTRNGLYARFASGGKIYELELREVKKEQ